MRAAKIKLYILLVIILYFICDSWWIMLTGNIKPMWPNVAAIVCFVPLAYLTFARPKLAVLAAIIYLLLGVITLISLSPNISRSWIGIGALNIPLGNGQCLLLLLLYAGFNLGFLIEWRLDHKESRQKK